MVRLQKENAMDLDLRDPYLSFKKSSCMISSNLGTILRFLLNHTKHDIEKVMVDYYKYSIYIIK